MKEFITSESVTEGHPDKICDKISDKILDTALANDKYSKMAVECTIKDNLILIYGEATTNANLEYEKIAEEVLKDIGYNENFKINYIPLEDNYSVTLDNVKRSITPKTKVISIAHITNVVGDVRDIK